MMSMFVAGNCFFTHKDQIGFAHALYSLWLCSSDGRAVDVLPESQKNCLAVRTVQCNNYRLCEMLEDSP